MFVVQTFSKKFKIACPTWDIIITLTISNMEVMFLHMSVCWLVGWFVSRITQKLLNGFPWHLDGIWALAQIRPFGVVLDDGLIQELFLT